MRKLGLLPLFALLLSCAALTSSAWAAPVGPGIGTSPGTATYAETAAYSNCSAGALPGAGGPAAGLLGVLGASALVALRRRR